MKPIPDGNCNLPATENNDVALVLAARLAPIEMRVHFGGVSSALIPLGNQPALQHIAEPFLAQGFRILVAAHEAIDLIRAHVSSTYDERVSVVDVGRTGSLGETVRNALGTLDSIPHRLVLNFGDTIVREAIVGTDAVLCQRRADTYRWTTFRTGSGNPIFDIVEKDQLKSASDDLRVFVGVFSFSDVAEFEAQISTALADESALAYDPLYRAVESYCAGRGPGGFVVQETDQWLDLGHLDTYYQSKLTHFTSARSFNDVAVDAARGVIRKASRDAEKFRNEIRWYHEIPTELSSLTPRVFEHDLSAPTPWAELEFYAYPSLADYYLILNEDLGGWERIVIGLDNVLDRLCGHNDDTADRAHMARAIEIMYLDKTVERLGKIWDAPWAQPLLRDEVAINGVRCAGLRRVEEMLANAIERLVLRQVDAFSVIHGDLCASNILFDHNTGIIRIVDPRGNFGSFNIHGDPRYDLAKIAHSFHGDYDLILNDRFALSANQGEITLEVRRSPLQDTIRTMVVDWLRSRAAAEWPKVCFIESLLFLSMLPMHADKPACQMAFAVRGIELFHQALDAAGCGTEDLG